MNKLNDFPKIIRWSIKGVIKGAMSLWLFAVSYNVADSAFSDKETLHIGGTASDEFKIEVGDVDIERRLFDQRKVEAKADVTISSHDGVWECKSPSLGITDNGGPFFIKESDEILSVFKCSVETEYGKLPHPGLPEGAQEALENFLASKLNQKGFDLEF